MMLEIKNAAREHGDELSAYVHLGRGYLFVCWMRAPFLSTRLNCTYILGKVVVVVVVVGRLCTIDDSRVENVADEASAISNHSAVFKFQNPHRPPPQLLPYFSSRSRKADSSF